MIKKLIGSEKGASSILVILLLVVLMVFGVAALTTALSSMRLGQKVAEWNAQYYEAEAIAWERFAQIDRALADISNADEESVKKKLDALDFDTDIEKSGAGFIFYYETWSKDTMVGIDVALSFQIFDKGGTSLRATQWREIQREGAA